MSKTLSRLVEPTLETNAYADGDLLFDCFEVPQFFTERGGSRALHSLIIYDYDDQGIAMDVLFMRANEDLGTANDALAMTDAESLSITGRVQVTAGDWFDWGSQRTAIFTNIGQVLQGPADGTSLWLAAVTRGAPTYTASGLKFRIGTL
jgi:hypothetical protein